MAREDQRVEPKMALQVDEALAGNIAELAELDRMQPLVAGEKALDRVKPGAVAPMDRHPLVPIALVGGQEFIAWHDPLASSILKGPCYHRGEPAMDLVVKNARLIDRLAEGGLAIAVAD